MAFLIAKILFLLGLAAAFGAWLAWWTMRRRYEDVTVEYAEWKKDWSQWRGAVDSRLAQPPQVDLAPLGMRLEQLEARLAGLRFPEPPQPADLGPVTGRLAALEDAVRGLHLPEVDLGGLSTRLDLLGQRIGAMRVPDGPVVVDLSPLLARLDGLEHLVGSLRPPSAPPAPVAAVAPAPVPAPSPDPTLQGVRTGSRNLLAQASYGPPDDLKLIKGVAEVLEKMLHGIGVYYFWQIADWTPADIEHVDSQLTAFKGRVGRDEWVRQSAEFEKRPGSARRP